MQLVHHHRVIRIFGERKDSKSVILGIGSPGDGIVAKMSADAAGMGWLRNGLRFHQAVQHPVIVPVLDSFEASGWFGLVMPWAAGETLVDGFDESVPDRESTSSTAASSTTSNSGR